MDCVEFSNGVAGLLSLLALVVGVLCRYPLSKLSRCNVKTLYIGCYSDGAQHFSSHPSVRLKGDREKRGTERLACNSSDLSSSLGYEGVYAYVHVCINVCLLHIYVYELNSASKCYFST